MKWMMKLLARFYPLGWRARYGCELEGLLEETRPSVRNAFDILRGALKMQMTTWSFSRIMVACAAAGILTATAISFAVPVHYQSEVALMVTPPEEAGNLHVSQVAKTVLSRESLSSIIQENNLYPRERAAMPLEGVISKMQSKIRVIPVQANLAGNLDALTFTIQFDYPDPHVAQQVDSELTSRFLERNLATAMASPLNDSRWTFHVFDPPSLPQVPAGPNRPRFAAFGLLAGILCGLAAAIAARTRRITALPNG